MRNSADQLRILMTAGEVSGDRQAARLAQEMFAQDQSIRIYGTGGDKMREAGVEIVAHTSQYGSVGLQESLRFVRPLRRTLRRIREVLSNEPPDLAVLVDNEGFNGIVARYLHRADIPFIYYFPPQVWLWGEWRARRIARQAHLIIPAFRPEADIYAREGGRVEWYGHPLIDMVNIRRSPDDVLMRLGVSPDQELVGIMPGSRHQEVEQLCMPMLGAARLILEQYPAYRFILPLAAPHLRSAIEPILAETGMSNHVILVSRDVYECLSRCKLLLLSSGTATLEAALLGIPMVVAYRVSAMTYVIGRRVVKSRFIAMPNILLNEEIIPEVLQDSVTATRLGALALSILQNPERSSLMRGRLLSIRKLLGNPGVVQNVAGSVLREAYACMRTQALS